MALIKVNNTTAEGEKLLQKALVFYRASIQKCPSHHSDAYYYTARILYSYSEKDAALSYLESFMQFDSLYPGEQASNYYKFKEEIKPVYFELRFPINAKVNPVPFNVKKVEGVSTFQDEYFPMLSPDNSQLFLPERLIKLILAIYPVIFKKNLLQQYISVGFSTRQAEHFPNHLTMVNFQTMVRRVCLPIIES